MSNVIILQQVYVISISEEIKVQGTRKKVNDNE